MGGGVCVRASFVVAVVAALALCPDPCWAFSTACKWADNLLGDVLEKSSIEVQTDVWVSLGTGNYECAWNTPAFKVNMVRTHAPGSDGANHEVPVFQDLFSSYPWYSQVLSEVGTDEIHGMVWDRTDLKRTHPQWGESLPFHEFGLGWSFPDVQAGLPKALRTLRIYVVSLTPSPHEGGKDKLSLNSFAISYDKCTSPMPLVLTNPDNPVFSCIRVALFPDLCEHAFGVTSEESAGSELALEFGQRPLINGLRSPECAYSGERHRVLLSGKALGTDEDDRTWKAILGMEGEQKGAQIFSDTTRGRYEWAFRTSADYRLQLSYVSAPSSPDLADAQKARQESEDEGGQGEQEEMDRERAAVKKRLNAMVNRAAVTEAMHQGPVPPRAEPIDLGRQLDDEAAPVTLLEPKEPEKCAVGDDAFPNNVFAKRHGWVEMEVLHAEGKDTGECVRFQRLAAPATKRLKFHSEQCHMVREILDNKEQGVSHAVYIKVGAITKESIAEFAKQTNTRVTPSVEGLSAEQRADVCKLALDKSEDPEFMLVLRADRDTGAWYHASPLLEGRQGDARTWRWKTDEYGDISLRFDAHGATQVFESTKCKHGAVRFPVDLVANDRDQLLHCVRLFGRSATNCRNAMGMTDDNPVVSFEASLATMVHNTKNGVECVYMPPFVVSLVDRDHHIGEVDGGSFGGIVNQEECPSPAAKEVLVSGSHAPMAEQWRWRSDDNGRLELSFPTLLTWDGQPKRVWEVFNSISADNAAGQCPVSHSTAFPPPQLLDEDTLQQLGVVGDPGEDQDENNSQARTPNDVYKCLRLQRIGEGEPTRADKATYRQQMMVEQMKDMAVDPREAEGDSHHGDYNRLMAQFQDYAHMKMALKEQLQAEEYHSSVTREAGTEYDNLAAGTTSHFGLMDELPAGHPTIEKGKVVHSDGMVAPAEFVATHENPYSGLLGKETVPLIVRYSSALPHDADGFIPGWAFKFFRDAPAPNSDLLTYHSFEMKRHCDVLRHAVSNFPSWTPDAGSGEAMSSIHPSMKFLLQRGQALRREANATATGTNFPMRLGISHLFLDDHEMVGVRLGYNRRSAKPDDEPDQPTGDLPRTLPPQNVQRANYPDQLILVPHATAARHARNAVGFSDSEEPTACRGMRGELTERQLRGIPPRTPLFDVYGVESASVASDLNAFMPSSGVHMGTIYLQDRFFKSWYANAVVHFKHELYESDLEHPDHNKNWAVSRNQYVEKDSFGAAVDTHKGHENQPQAEIKPITSEQWQEMKPALEEDGGGEQQGADADSGDDEE